MDELFQTKVLNTLLFIVAHEEGIAEGEGGKRATNVQDYEVGTGLRHPDYPLYNTHANQRRKILNTLLADGLIQEKDGKYYATDKPFGYFIKRNF